ncbi:MAG: SpoIIE family protein phosphatase [Acidobacteria bacterium]|nr:SpoIIE family protein phosphatase [Acidobacteriota bacterium]
MKRLLEARRLRWPLLALLGAAVMHLLIRVAGTAERAPAAAGLFELIANLAIAAAIGYIAFIVLVGSLRRLLWSVRRKLILSYIFTGVVPLVLIASLFLLAGTLTLLAFSSYMVTLRIDNLVREASNVGAAAAGELDAGGGADPAAVLTRHRRALTARGLTASVELVAAARQRAPAAGAAPLNAVGVVPGWLAERSFAGLAAVRGDAGVQFVIRAVQPVAAGRSGSVMVDLLMDPAAVARIERVTGATVRGATIVTFNDDDADRRIDAEPVFPVAEPDRGAFVSADGLAWFTVLQHTDWESGNRQFLALNVRVSPAALYRNVFGAQARIGDFSLGYAYLAVFVVVALLFLIIEAGALVMGIALASSIIGAVHELFTGTARVQQGDFTHRIRVRSRDQLGELGQSFNSMTASVRDLLRQVGEKKRLEEELRIAHEVQMSLLPRDSVTVPGIDVTGACIPAREVGGDYYDFIRLGERQLGVLVADVSGKGTPAAFYMAELKGLVLSLSRIHQSPRQMLIEVNRLVADNIESGRFITMMYAVIDADSKTLTCARAGHTPLIHVPGGGGAARVVTPDGLIAGLPGFEQRFEAIIEEETREIEAGDLVALFTDGITEAMDANEDQFGEQRLARVLEEHRAADVAAVRQEVLGDVSRFVGAAQQHDDMTLVLLKVREGERG